MIKTLPITEARENLTTLVDKADKQLNEYVITVNGRPAAVLMSAAEYEGRKETDDILADKELMKAIRKGEKELSEGKFITLEQLEKELGWDV